MVTLRCTQKLLRRVASGREGISGSPTTLLSDWYANILFSKPQHLILCISERTLLPVVVPAKQIHTLPERFKLAVQDVLAALGVPPSLAERELSEMQPLCYGRTQNKSLLGTLNDLTFALAHSVEMYPNEPQLQRSLYLAETPCKPIGYNSPDRETMEVFATANLGGPLIH